MSEEKEFVKVGVVGCGMISAMYRLITKFVKNTKIVTAVDPVIERAKKIAGKKGNAYDNAEKMYKNEDIDVVYIATPHHLHKPMIKQALEEGKHVFCEKPLTVSVQDAREIYEMDKNHPDLKVGINYQYRYDPNCYKLVRAIQNGHLGKVYYANCAIYFSRNLNYFDEGPWRTKWETAGGGTLIIHGSHILDIMIWALGEPISVMGKIDTLKFKNIEVEDVGFGLVQFEDNVYAQLSDSMILKSKARKFGNDKVELKVFGEKGSCHYVGPSPFSSLKWKGVKKYKVDEKYSGLFHYGKCIKAYGNWILNDEPFLNTVEESAKVLRMTMALYKSSKSGKKEIIEKL